MTYQEKYDAFCKVAPLTNVKLSGGEFPCHYYKNPDPKNDVTLVMLPGGTGLGEGMFFLADYFMPKYSMVSFNYPMWAKNNSETASAIAELAEKLGLTNAYLLGQSYGGLLAQIIAKEHPGVFKGMILSGTCSLSTDGMTFEGMSCLAKMLDEKKVQKNLKTDKKLPLKLLFLLMGPALKKRIPDEKMRTTFLEIMDICKSSMTREYLYHMDVLLADLRPYFGTHSKADFASYRGEVLEFFSQEDTTFTEDLKEALRRVMTDPVVVNDLQGGHLAMMADIDRYVATLDGFLAARNPNYASMAPSEASGKSDG